MASVTIGDVVICSAIEMLQLHECIDTRVFCESSNGINAEISTHFSSTLRMSATSPAQINQFFRDLTGLLGPLVGYLSVTSIDARADKSTSDFIAKFINTTGFVNGGYIPMFGKFIPSAVYAPLCKYLAMKSGIGPRPQSHPQMYHAYPNPDGANGTHIFVDGADLVLHVHHVAVGDHHNVTYPNILEGGHYVYTNVTMSRILGHDSHTDMLAQMTINSNGQGGVLTTAGIIHFNNNITVTVPHAEHSLCVRFHGRFIANTLWRGTYNVNEFDPSPHTHGFFESIIHFGTLSRLDSLTSIWAGAIGSLEGTILTNAAAGNLAAFGGTGIFSQSCLHIIAQDASYVQGKTRIGKNMVSKLLSVLHSIFIMHQLVDRYMG